VSPVAVAPLFRWNLHPADPARRDRLAASLKLGPLAAQVLLNRGVSDLEEARGMLPPSLASLPDPLRMPGCAAAIEVLSRAADRRARVLVHGDYDVDGTCGSVLLHRLLTRLGMDVEVFVPDRVQDGYSFGVRSLDAVAAHGADLVVSVDNGTSALEPIAELRARGVETVVVDHHLPGAELPDAAALMNPWVAPEDADLPFRHFCGTAVAWLLAWGLLRERLGTGTLPEADRRFLFDSLGLAAIATIGDVMPLRGPNRAIVSQGLRGMPESTLPGLRALCESAGVRGAPSASDVAFRIAPRLNAAGRMHRAELAFATLAASGAVEAQRLCAELETLNAERRVVTERERLRFVAQVEAQRERGDHVLFAGDEDAHFGVLGIVANQLMDATGLPTLLWAGCGPGVARGSARAPEGQDLTEVMAAADDLFEGWGGHARAAGFHFDPKHADAVGEALRTAAARMSRPAPPTIEVDAEIQPGEIGLPALLELARLEPWGEGFVEPLFLCTGARLAAAPRPIGDGSHVEMRLEKNGEVVRVLGWRQADRVAGLTPGDRVDVVVSVGINEFRGRRSVEWTLRDLRSSTGEA
jgi:single-stranded-DNA-specific exonuclease